MENTKEIINRQQTNINTKNVIMYTITLSEKQMELIADCLEDVSRFASGQWEMKYTIEAMLKDLSIDEQIERRDEAEVHLKAARKVLMPEQGFRNYNGTEFIGNIYQIYRTILHQLAIDRGVKNVYSSPALPSGNLGTIKIEKLGASKYDC